MYTYKLGGMLITDELYHDDLEAMTFGRKDQNELMHYGIKGQSWGKRRFQNEDGSLTAAGRNRYDVGDPKHGVTAYSGTGGRGGSGVSYNRLPGGTGASTRFATVNQAPARFVGSNPRGRSGTATTTQKVSNTTNAGRKAADNLFGRIGNWASDAAKDVGNFATNTYNDASKAVSNAANAVGNTVKNAAQDVSDWYTGDKAGKEAEKYDRVVQNFERNGDQNINAGQDIISRGLKYPESAYDLESGQSMRDKTVIEGLDRRNLGYDQHDIARQYGQKADEAQARYENAPRQLLERAGNWVSDRAQDAKDFINYEVTGNGYRDLAKNWTDYANGVKTPDNEGYNASQLTAEENARKSQEYADNSLLGRIGNTAKNVGDWASNAASDVRDWGAGALDKGRQAFESLFGRSEPANNERFDPTPRTFTENIIEEQRIPEQRITEDRIEEQRIPETIIREGEKYTQMTPDQRQARMDSQKNRPTVSDSDNVQTWDNGNINTWDNVQTFGDSDMVNTIKMLNNNGFFNRGSSANSGNSAPMTDKPDGVSDEYWRDYTFNGGTRESYDRENRNRKIENAQREQRQKELLSDKPNNVSNEYWEAYKSNGGTRESYDREMKNRKSSAVPLSSDKDYAAEQERLRNISAQQDRNGFRVEEVNAPVGTVDTSRPYHFTYDPASGQTIVVYDDEKRR